MLHIFSFFLFSPLPHSSHSFTSLYPLFFSSSLYSLFHHPHPLLPLLSLLLSLFLSYIPHSLLLLPTGTSCVIKCSITYYKIYAGIRCEFSDGLNNSSNGTGVLLVFKVNGERVFINLTREIATTGHISQTRYVQEYKKK